MPMQVELVSPERVVYEGEAELIIARTVTGEIGFQEGHIPFVGSLVPSVVRMALTGGGVQHIAVHSGFIEASGSHVTILSDIAELAEDIDVERARAALDKAIEARKADDQDTAAMAAEARAQARLRAGGDQPA